jgi:hypothetical protein
MRARQCLDTHLNLRRDFAIVWIRKVLDAHGLKNELEVNCVIKKKRTELSS